MSVVAVIGAQWGDEGKGKVIDAIAPKAALVAQYAGGYNPGQTMVANGERFVFHIVPSGALRAGKRCLLGQGMALDPQGILSELAILAEHGALAGQLEIDRRALVVLPHHIELDRLRDEAEGASGAPRHGLGPAYQDGLARRGVRIGELGDADLIRAQVEASIAAAEPDLARLGGEAPDPAKIVDQCGAAAEALRERMVDGSRLIGELAASGDAVVLEGLMGTMVDEHHGYYPFVVGASTVAGGACTGTGIPPRMIDRVLGVAKAYITRPGPGPFPSELTGELASILQDRGGELSPATAHPRRCGMFDIPVLRYAARVNGFDAVAITKLDVLTGIDEIPICVGYDLDGDVRDEPPFTGQSRMQPLTEMLPGWTENLSDCRRWEDLPANARGYVEFIEKNSGVSVELVSVGPDRAQTIRR